MVKVPTVAKSLAMGEATFRKSIDAGFNPPDIDTLRHADLLELDSVSRIEIERPTDGGGTVTFIAPVLRPCVAELASDQSGRKYVGVKEDMTVDEFEDATLKYWPPACSQLAVDSGYLFVVLGGFIVGVLRIDKWNFNPGAEKGYFEGQLIARWRGHITTGHAVLENPDPLADDLLSFMGLRAPGGGGGSITPWNA
ncbi:hypothetical protein L5G28_11355 [Gordonia sp. HY285]|uniref:hypothetical protein n=1 Tax=Gordonia liuliyuniae TaxID=2911517 RepID=UPI001F39901D|nr:hypothetical protein [Gordonia liuliyuniae]MCF8610750.1 hypothetical protein [Gordonia liuliyuniae]